MKKVKRVEEKKSVLENIIKEIGLNITDLGLENTHSPWLFKQMERAVSKIIQALDNNEKILIYGDADVDGITSARVVVEAFLKIGFKKKNIFVHLPDKGYGMQDEVIEKHKNKGVTLIITVDCGTTNYAQIDCANELGMDVIVTDHHCPLETLPKAYAVINPKEDKKYPFEGLAGVGVAFKLAQALYETFEVHKKNLFELLSLVALGTLADYMPLTQENRIMVRMGLQRLFKIKQERKSLQALIASFKNHSLSFKGFNDLICYKVIPCLNAAGKLNNPKAAYAILDDDDNKYKINEKVEILQILHKEKKNLKDDLFSKLEEKIKKSDPNKDFIFIDLGLNGIERLLGEVSSDLCNRYKRIIFVVMVGDDGKCRCSVRVPDFLDINIVKFLKSFSEYLTDFGGHTHAAGMGFLCDKLEIIQREIEKTLAEQDVNIKEKRKKGEKEKKYITIKLEDVTMDLINKLDKMVPFGSGNPHLRFQIKDVVIDSVKNRGNITFLTLANLFGNEDVKIEAATFLTDMFSEKEDEEKWNRKLNEDENYEYYNEEEDEEDKYKKGDNITILCTPQLKEYRGERYTQLLIQKIW